MEKNLKIKAHTLTHSFQLEEESYGNKVVAAFHPYLGAFLPFLSDDAYDIRLKG